MVINLTYLFAIVIAIVIGIMTYIHKRNRLIIWELGILLFSLILEVQWLNLGNYVIDTTDIFWTIRDISWTIVVIVLFKYIGSHKKAIGTGDDK